MLVPTVAKCQMGNLNYTLVESQSQLNASGRPFQTILRSIEVSKRTQNILEKVAGSEYAYERLRATPRNPPTGRMRKAD